MLRSGWVWVLHLALAVSFGQACRCLQEAFCKKTERADYLFRGIVLEVYPSKDHVTFVIEAQEMFKSPPGRSQQSTFALRSPNTGSQCGMKLAVNGNYLFASDIDFWITSCGASKPWESISKPDLIVLEAGGLCEDCATLNCNSDQRCTRTDGLPICSDICQPGRCAQHEVCQLVPISNCINGPCPSIAACRPLLPKRTCLHNCSSEFQPVCGSNGITYSNECLLKNAACKDPSIQLQKAGECCSRSCCKFRECRRFSKGEYCTDTCQVNRCPKGYRCRLQKSKLCTPDFCPEVAVCEPACNHACPDKYSPICGSNGVTFANRCELKKAQCQDSSLTAMHHGICSLRDSVCGQPIACPEIYDPICGSDGVTYPNTCSFELARCETENLTMKREGTCEAVCDLNCPSTGHPVCSNHGITYRNECLLKQAACKHGNIWLKKNGACDRCP